MTDRRRFLALIAGTGLAAAANTAIAQAFKVPPPEDLLRVLRSPALVEGMLASTSALRTLLLLELARTGKGEAAELWMRDRERFFYLWGLVRDPKFQAEVTRLLETRETRAYSPAITERALPAVKRMEEALAKGGLAAGSPLSSALFTSFLNVNRYLVIQSTANDRWYCHIYPLSVFCG